MMQFADIQTFEEFSRPLRRSKIQTPAQQLESYRGYVENERKNINADLDRHLEYSRQEYVENERKHINADLDRHLEYARQQTDKAIVLERAIDNLATHELMASFEQAKFPPTTDPVKRLKDCVSGESTLTDLECEELDYQVKTKLGEW